MRCVAIHDREKTIEMEMKKKIRKNEKRWYVI
jgi:hypothetical protein